MPRSPVNCESEIETFWPNYETNIKTYSRKLYFLHFTIALINFYKTMLYERKPNYSVIYSVSPIRIPFNWHIRLAFNKCNKYIY